MALLSLVSFPIGMIFMKKIMKGYPKQFAGAVQVGGEMNSSIVEYIEGIEVIKAFNQGDEQYKKFSEKIKANANYYCKWMKDVQFLMSMSKSVMPTTLLAVLPLGWIFFKNGNLQAEIFLMVIILAFSISGLLTEAMNFVDSLARVGTILDSVDSIILEEEQDHASKEVMLKNLDIELNDLRFSYNNEDEVIKGISMYLKEGSFNAFLGPFGSGKTTLCNLIARFWDINTGQILLGGRNIKEYSLESLMNKISMVFQKVYLFEDTIENNIKFGNQDASLDEVIKAAKKACCHDFIMELPEAYQTMIGEGGANLSGGEKQRISIARAMLKNAPIVILDEATANVDPENEDKLQKAIDALMKEKTVIMIAHRLKTVQNADQIIVLDRGKIVEKGNHEELLEKKGLYSDFIKIREEAESWKL